MFKPRILIFSIAYDPLIGGAELAVRNITDRLSLYEFDLITCRFKREYKAIEKIGNVNVYRVGFGSRLGRYLYPVFAYRLAAKLHNEKPYQVVWSIMAAYAGAAALLFLRRYRAVKFLLTLQEGDPIEHIQERVRGFRNKWQEVFKKADHVQAISNFLADWARREGATCPITVVPNGVDLTKFQISNFKFQKKPKSQIQKIISVSRLVPKNGIDILIRAAAELKSLIPNSRFQIQILGTGDEEQALKRLARDLKVDDVVVFLGDIEPNLVPQYLAQADIFVRPSRSEGLGSAFLEAMAAGLPVVGTAVGGIPDFLKDRNTGLFSQVDDPSDLALKIRELIEDDNLRKTVGGNGRKLVEEKYTWDKIAGKIDQIFRNLAPGSDFGDGGVR